MTPTTVVKILTEQSVGGTHVLPPPGNKNSGLESSNEGRPPVPGENDKATIQVTTAEVKLLKAVRIPARHAKRVTGHTESNLGDQDLYLESLQKNLNTEKVKATEALVKIDPHNQVAVLIENHETFPVTLEAGTRLGVLHQVQTVADDKLSEVVSKELDNFSTLTNDTTALLEASDRTQQVMEQLNVEWSNTSAKESAELASLITEFSDVFAINAMEVGHTNLVQHHINTADHAPVKQAPRRVPFSLRTKVEEGVREC